MNALKRILFGPKLPFTIRGRRFAVPVVAGLLLACCGLAGISAALGGGNPQPKADLVPTNTAPPLIATQPPTATARAEQNAQTANSGLPAPTDTPESTVTVVTSTPAVPSGAGITAGHTELASGVWMCPDDASLAAAQFVGSAAAGTHLYHPAKDNRISLITASALQPSRLQKPMVTIRSRNPLSLFSIVTCDRT